MRQGLGGGWVGPDRWMPLCQAAGASEGDVPELASFMDEEATALALTAGDDQSMENAGGEDQPHT